MKALHFDIGKRLKGTQRGAAQAHVRYIMRTPEGAGAHAAYVTRSHAHVREDLVATGTGNLPTWAQNDPIAFFTAADRWERTNGRTATQITAALPRALTPAQQSAAVDAFVVSQLGTKHAYVWGMHETGARDGGRYPHVHIAFSERRDAGRDLAPSQYFSQNGNQKDRTFHARQWPAAARQAWSDTLNVALEAAGSRERVSARSFQDQGMLRDPVSRIPRQDLREHPDRLRALPRTDDTPEMLATRTQEWEARKRELGLTRSMSPDEIIQRIGDASRAAIAAERDRVRVLTQGWTADELATRREQVRALRQAEERYMRHPHELRTPAHLAAVASVLQEAPQPQGHSRMRPRWEQDDETDRRRGYAREW